MNKITCPNETRQAISLEKLVLARNRVNAVLNVINNSIEKLPGETEQLI